MIKTFKYRIKDSNSNKILDKLSREVNFVWNYCNTAFNHNVKNYNKWLSEYEISRLLSGATKEGLNIAASTLQEIVKEFFKSRNQAKKIKLRYRGKKSLGWIPFKSRAVRLNKNCVIYRKNIFKFWKSREILGKIKTGSFNQDSRGRWYINIVCELEQDLKCGNGEIGIDLGVISTATTSSGDKLTSREYKKLEKRISMSQRANKKKLRKTLNAKVKNKRKDSIEKFTTKLVKNNKLIVIGNVSSSKLTKTRLAKSVLDNGWSILKTRLSHKAIMHEATLIEVNEAYTSRTCSNCEVGWNLPKGLKSLAVREYVCPSCNVEHDRDINAARNILRIGHYTLLKGISSR